MTFPHNHAQATMAKRGHEIIYGSLRTKILYVCKGLSHEIGSIRLRRVGDPPAPVIHIICQSGLVLGYSPDRADSYMVIESAINERLGGF